MIRRLVRIGVPVCVCACAVLWLTLMPRESAAAPPHKGTITGTITTDDGAPYAGAAVRLYGGGAIDYLAETTSDSDGNYRLRRVIPGDYTVVATSSSTSITCHGSAPATVVGGQTTVVNVEMTCEVFPP